MRFSERLNSPRPILLDGATGTELHRRGVNTDLPLWSAAALLSDPGLIEQIHRDYATAGAEVITTNTFRVHRRNLERAGIGDRASELTRLAVELARRSGAAFVAGSIAPLEDCYRPELAPSKRELAEEHRWMAADLADAGVDLILAETHNNIAEAEAAVRAGVDTSLPTIVSFVCKDAHLLSGEPLPKAVLTVSQYSPVAIMVNCSPTPDISALLAVLQAESKVPIGAYGNIGRPDERIGWIRTDATEPEQYANYAAKWIALGAQIVGGCCGTTPEHLRQLAERLD